MFPKIFSESEKMFSFNKSIVALVLSLFVPALATADYTQLLKQVPPGANYLILADADDIANAARQSDGRQIQDFLNASKAWPMIAVWNPTKIVVASELIIQHMEPQWEMAAISLAAEATSK